MPTKLAKLLRLQVLASHGNHPDTGAASAARRKLRPVLVCHWRSHPVDGRLECRWRLEPREGSSDETPGQSPRLSKARPRRRITPRRRRSTCGRWTTDKRKLAKRHVCTMINRYFSTLSGFGETRAVVERAFLRCADSERPSNGR